jgi:prepilin-type N-terminal cleavage/methylation domain-containing protein
MNSLKEECRGFTIIELIIAVAISALIMAGLYVLTSGLINTKSGLDSANTDLVLSNSVELMISRDLRMMSSQAASNDNNSRNRDYLFTIQTYNSLTFGKALPVSVSYFVDNATHTLYRQEFSNDMNYNMLMPLVKNVSDPLVETFNGTEYRENFVRNGYIFRVSFMLNNRHISFITGRPSASF